MLDITHWLKRERERGRGYNWRLVCLVMLAFNELPQSSSFVSIISPIACLGASPSISPHQLTFLVSLIAPLVSGLCYVFALPLAVLWFAPRWFGSWLLSLSRLMVVLLLFISLCVCVRLSTLWQLCWPWCRCPGHVLLSLSLALAIDTRCQRIFMRMPPEQHHYSKRLALKYTHDRTVEQQIYF